MIDCLSIAVYAFARRILTSLSVDETLLPIYMGFFTNFREPPFRMEVVQILEGTKRTDKLISKRTKKTFKVRSIKQETR